MLTDNNIIDKIDKVSDLAKKCVVDTAPYRYWINRYFQLLELQRKREKEIKVLVVKRLTLGLTYFEKKRLRFFSPR